MILFLRATASGLLDVAAGLAERAADRLRPPLDYQPRLIRPPKVGRWLVVALSRYPAGGERVVGRYRLRWVARLIASRMPKVSTEQADYVVVPAPSRATGGAGDE